MTDQRMTGNYPTPVAHDIARRREYARACREAADFLAAEVAAHPPVTDWDRRNLSAVNDVIFRLRECGAQEAP